MKKEVPLSRANRLLNPGPVVLVTARYKDAANVMAASWVVPLSFEPPVVGLAVHPGCFTHELIVRSGEFVLNVPGRALLEAVHRCGTLSGRDGDKFAEAGLTPAQASQMRAPLIEECLGHLECAVMDAYEVGDHTLFVGEVVAAQAEEETFDEVWLLPEDEEARPLHHLGGAEYGVLAGRLSS